MLGPGRYLLGAGELVALAGLAWLGATSLRKRLVPDLAGAPAHLATLVFSIAILIWAAELLGTFGAFEPLPYLLLVGFAGGVMTWRLLPRVAGDQGGRGQLGPQRPPDPPTGPAGRPRTVPGPAGRSINVLTLIALAIATVAVLHFADGVVQRLGTGMTGFDSTWYHGPFAAGFFQSGDTWGLHFIAPQFLAWFYPANSEVLHAVGMNAFDRDVLSPLLNLGWFAGCLFACWCIGRRHRVAPWSLALGAAGLSIPALSDQAGEARNDIVGIFFLLAAVALAIDLRGRAAAGGGRLPAGALLVVGLAAGLAAGTKLDFVLPAAVLVAGLAAVQPGGRRLRSLGLAAAGALAGGGYWYLRNLVHSGNPLPWFDHLGPLDLPAPGQALGGREQHSVLGYLTDGSVWSEWLLPGLHHGVGLLWPLLVSAALGGLVLCLAALRRAKGGAGSGDRDPVLAVAGMAGLASVLAWLVAPTSASGPDGMPHGFESGLRYLAPALVLGLALLPVGVLVRLRAAGARRGAGTGLPLSGRILKVPRPLARDLSGRGESRARLAMWVTAVVFVVIAVGYPVQRHYLRDRYADPAFTTPGLNAAFRWARGISGARIATTSTRQYPLFGTDLSNRVQFVGEERARGGFVAPSTCRAWRRLLDEGEYDYVVASLDRVQPGKPPYPPTAEWTEGPGAAVVLRVPPTVVFHLTRPPDPGTCPS
jgi:hypothetical protein